MARSKLPRMPQTRNSVPLYHNRVPGPAQRPAARDGSLERRSMSISAHRWLMTAPPAPLVRAPFNAAAGHGEVVVAIAGCGVCHTDLGYYYDGVRTNMAPPLALGHEISGTVVETGPGAMEWLGKRVIVPAVLPCGECDLCKRGLATICRAQKMPGNDIQGGFASHVVVPARGLCEV